MRQSPLSLIVFLATVFFANGASADIVCDPICHYQKGDPRSVMAKTKAPKVDLAKDSVTGKHIKHGKIVVREGSAGQTTTDANKLLQARDASTGMATGKRQ